MGYHKNKWLNSEGSSTVLFYKRYVEAICLFKSETDAEHFQHFGQRPNIKFTITKEKNNQLPFLDILNESSSNKLVASVYRKAAYTGLLTNYNSFTFLNYKKGLIKTLIDQTFRVSSTWSGFHYDSLDLKLVLQKNEFPLKLIDKSISKYLFLYSDKNETYNIVLKYCKPNTNIELVFLSFIISSLFLMKDRVAFDLRSYVVYKFICGCSKDDYIGRKKRHLLGLKNIWKQTKSRMYTNI